MTKQLLKVKQTKRQGEQPPDTRTPSGRVLPY